VERGCGYPPHRRESQQQSRETVEGVSSLTHRPFAEVIATLPDEVIRPAIEYPGIKDLIDVGSIEDERLRATFLERM
jgi:hypothetical protein